MTGGKQRNSYRKRLRNLLGHAVILQNQNGTKNLEQRGILYFFYKVDEQIPDTKKMPDLNIAYLFKTENEEPGYYVITGKKRTKITIMEEDIRLKINKNLIKKITA